ncbi:hypothetical protein HYW76_02515 [Candidatus Pacearchaeota archaeon]|nr:hypothetical protein [Candidatus Pacearchaeota archaeon]
MANENEHSNGKRIFFTLTRWNKNEIELLQKLYEKSGFNTLSKFIRRSCLKGK